MGGGNMGTLQALLTELSGLKKPRGFINRYVRRLLGMRPKPPPKYRILVMMATNMPNALDEALLRPGRIDRIYKVGYPSKEGRVRTYQGYFAKVKHELTDEQIDKLATITPYYSGAKIKDLVNEALIMAIRDGRDVITWQDVMKAKHLKSLGPPEGVEYVERERHATAVHEACHAVMAYRVRHHLEIDIATIEKGAGYLGMVSSIPVEDQFTEWRSTYEADILVSLASLAGERMFFGNDNSSGVSGDLDSATTVAALMETHWGMGSGISSLPALQRLQIMPGKPDPRRRDGQDKGGKEAIADGLGERIERTLSRLLEKAEQILRENRAEVLAVAHALETHKTLSGDDVAAVIEGRQGTILDGSVYKDPAFMAEIEEYHEAGAARPPEPGHADAAAARAAAAAAAHGPAAEGRGGRGREQRPGGRRGRGRRRPGRADRRARDRPAAEHGAGPGGVQAAVAAGPARRRLAERQRPARLRAVEPGDAATASAAARRAEAAPVGRPRRVGGARRGPRARRLHPARRGAAQRLGRGDRRRHRAGRGDTGPGRLLRRAADHLARRSARAARRRRDRVPAHPQPAGRAGAGRGVPGPRRRTGPAARRGDGPGGGDAPARVRGPAAAGRPYLIPQDATAAGTRAGARPPGRSRPVRRRRTGRGAAQSRKPRSGTISATSIWAFCSRPE